MDRREIDAFDRANVTADEVRRRVDAPASVAIVLGSGLGAFADRLSDAVTVPYGDLSGWPVPHVVGHAGVLVAGSVAGRRVLALSGRAHFYEGHSMEAVTFPMRVLARLGVTSVILTNAAGGLNPTFWRGALMIVDDHINLMGANPLAGPNDDRFGPRFPDMSEVYARRLRRVADEAANAIDERIEHGVYLAVSGPSYETPAEIRAFRTLGADAVGMSTVPEALVACHMGVEVLGLSCITNPAAGLSEHPVTAEEVLETTAGVRDRFIALMEAILERL